jgi:hypothetical protein
MDRTEPAVDVGGETESLVTELEEIEARSRGGVGSVEDGIRRQEIERTLVVRMGQAAPPGDEHRWFVRLPCQITARVGNGEQQVAASVTDIGGGGASVTAPIEVWTHDRVELDLEPHQAGAGGRFRLSGRVAWRQPSATDRKSSCFGIAFDGVGGAAVEAKLRRLVLHLMRERVPRG